MSFAYNGFMLLQQFYDLYFHVDGAKPKPSNWCFQVHLVNLTSSGDGSLLNWAIFPGGSSNYFLDATAIVSVLLVMHTF